MIGSCHVCKTAFPSAMLLKAHYEAKHPKEPIPPEVVEAYQAALDKKAAAAAKKDTPAPAAAPAKKKKSKKDELSALDEAMAGMSTGKGKKKK